MATAQAITNSIGLPALEDTDIGDLCKTSHFTVEPVGRNNSNYFIDQDEFIYDSECKLGDLMHSSNDSLQLIASVMFETGESLRTILTTHYATVGHKKTAKVRLWEVRIGSIRYIQVNKRVYSKKII